MVSILNGRLPQFDDSYDGRKLRTLVDALEKSFASINNTLGNLSPNTPLLSAYRSTSQAILAATITRVNFDTETEDTASAYDNVTNYRFQPLTAGWYHIYANVNFIDPGTNGGAAAAFLYIYKNGASIANNSFPKGIDNTDLVVGNGDIVCNVSTIVEMNGSTDYIDIRVQSGVACNLAGFAHLTFFQAFRLSGT